MCVSLSRFLKIDYLTLCTKKRRFDEFFAKKKQCILHLQAFSLENVIFCHIVCFFCFGSGQMGDAERCICLRVRFLFVNKKQGKIQCLKPSFLCVILDERDGEFCKHCRIF